MRLGDALLVAVGAGLLASCGGKEGPSVAPSPSPETPEPGTGEGAPAATVSSYYWLYVANEGSDVVSRLRFGPGGLVYEKAIPVGSVPGEVEGPVAVAVDPEGGRWFVVTRRGHPAGRLWKYETGTDQLLGRVELGSSPGALGLSPGGDLAFVANSVAGADDEGRRVPSTLSVVSTAGMREISRLATCGDARGNRLEPDGRHLYAVCRGDDVLVEVATRAPHVTRTARLDRDGACGPEWVEPWPGRDAVLVSCGRAEVVLEISTGSDGLRVSGAMEVGPGPRGMAVTPDGRWLLVALSGAGAVARVDLERREVMERIPTGRPSPRRVTVSPDGRYAFVTSRGEATLRGAVDVVDVSAGRRVATVEVEDAPAGLAFWRIRPAEPGG